LAYRPELDEARRRKLVAEAKMAELELAKAREEVIPANVVLATWQGLVVGFRSKMLAVPSRLAPAVIACATPAEAFELMERLVHEALEELSEQDMTDLVLLEASES
jgi:hypothetical protein